MNNEETIVKRPQDNQPKASETSQKESSEKKTNKKKRYAATAGAAVAGVAAGAGAAFAATTLSAHDEAVVEDHKDDQQTPADSTAEASQTEHNADAQTQPDEVIAHLDNESTSGEQDYTGHGGADQVMTNPDVQVAVDDSNSDDANEVQVLGVYEAQGDQGQTMHAAVLTDGQEVGAVIDLDGDGIADVLAVDENHNQMIDEGEVYDVSTHDISMQPFQDQYAMQQDPMLQDQMQQEQMQQDHDLMAHQATDYMPDYDNNADMQNV